jgi:hypothetical protein
LPRWFIPLWSMVLVKLFSGARSNEKIAPGLGIDVTYELSDDQSLGSEKQMRAP